MLIYAEASEYVGAYPGDPVPSNIDTLLRHASRLVRAATRCAIYDAATDGRPTDGAVSQAFTDATVAQASYWARLGLDPSLGLAGSEASVVGASRIGSAAIDYVDATARATARADALTQLCPDALWCLESAGLSTSVQVL